MDFSQSRPLVGITCTVLCAFTIVGVLTFAGPCVHEEGTVGACQWAARAIIGVASVSLVLSALRIFEMDEGERRGLDVGITLTGLLLALTPGVVVGLCTLETMHCNLFMAPFVRICGGLVALVALIDLVVRLLAIGKSKA